MGPVIGELAERCEALLQGRRTYRVSAAAWPERGGDPFSDWINRTQKYVVSDTLADADLTWNPTKLIRGANFLAEVAALRNQPGGDIYIYGSLSVVRALLTAELLDELILMIEPITLGGGKTLFPNDGELRKFELISAQTAPRASTGLPLPALTDEGDALKSGPNGRKVSWRWRQIGQASNAGAKTVRSGDRPLELLTFHVMHQWRSSPNERGVCHA
jgi:dihydrofolate reductase